MLSGVCVGCVSHGGGEWVRPVKEFGTLLAGDIRYRDGGLMAPFDLVDFHLMRPRPATPHVEDWTCDFVRQRPRLLRRLDIEERRRVLEAASTPGALDE